MANWLDFYTPPLSGDAHVDALLGTYNAWERAERSADGVMQYSFTLTADIEGHYDNVQPFSAAQQAATRLALAEMSFVTGIEFAEVTNPAAAQLHFANADFSFGGLFYPSNFQESDADGNITHYDADGIVYLHNGQDGGLDPQGTSPYQILLHEIGHALGLRHPHDGPSTLLPWEDSNAVSVMSYQGIYPVKSTYQAFDVAALRWLYGGDGFGGAGAFADGTTPLLITLDHARLVGSGGHDYMVGASGDDTLLGGGGNDMLIGAFGNDLLKGGAGDDSYYAPQAGDVLNDTSGIDTVYVMEDWTLGARLENLRAVGPLDSTIPVALTGNGLANIITGNVGGNLISGRGGNDSLDGIAGDDTLLGGGGDDLLRGGVGNDQMTGGDGADTFSFTYYAGFADPVTDFETGIDHIELNGGWMTALGGNGAFADNDPRFYSAAGALSGHDADDRVVFDTSSGLFYYDPDGSGPMSSNVIGRLMGGASLAASDIIVQGSELSGRNFGGLDASDTLAGTAAADTLKGNGGDDVITTGDGDDWLIGGDGADTLDGGAGDDVYVVTPGDALVDASGVDRVETTVSWTLGDAFEDLLVIGFAGVTANGNALDNRMVGNAGRDHLNGDSGEDELLGMGGADRLSGGAGVDLLVGGSGVDRFAFGQSGDANADHVSDFGRGGDRLQLDEGAFGALGAIGRFEADDARFYAAPGASAGHDADDRVIYDTSSGRVYYDADGNGSGTAVLVATLDNHAALQARDVIVT